MTEKKLFEIRPEFIPVYSLLAIAPLFIVFFIFNIFLINVPRIFWVGFWADLFVLVVFSTAKLVFDYLRHNYTLYTLYEDRIEFKQGILNTTFSSIKLKNIREIHLTESFVQKFWKLGTLRFITSANDSYGTGVCFFDVKYPAGVYHRIKALMDSQQIEK